MAVMDAMGKGADLGVEGLGDAELKGEVPASDLGESQHGHCGLGFSCGQEDTTQVPVPHP